MKTTKEFQVSKKGMTNKNITICSTDSAPFNRSEKIQKYISLGYTVYDMNGNKISK